MATISAVQAPRSTDAPGNRQQPEMHQPASNRPAAVDVLAKMDVDAFQAYLGGDSSLLVTPVDLPDEATYVAAVVRTAPRGVQLHVSDLALGLVGRLSQTPDGPNAELRDLLLKSLRIASCVRRPDRCHEFADLLFPLLTDKHKEPDAENDIYRQTLICLAGQPRGNGLGSNWKAKLQSSLQDPEYAAAAYGVLVTHDLKQAMRALPAVVVLLDRHEIAFDLIVQKLARHLKNRRSVWSRALWLVTSSQPLKERGLSDAVLAIFKRYLRKQNLLSILQEFERKASARRNTGSGGEQRLARRRIVAHRSVATAAVRVAAEPRIATLELSQIILRPLVTEKGVHRSHRNNQYAFEVNTRATKDDVRRAVEELFNVKVEKVRTQNRLGEHRRHRFKTGRTKGWKKAIVTLNAEHRITFF